MNKKTQDNIAAFNFLVLLVLNKLYDSFPERVDIDGLRTVIETLLEIGTDKKESNYLAHLSETIEWLEEEGFIKYKEAQHGNFKGVTLTMQGLTILGYMPTSLKLIDKKEPLIIKIKKILATGAEASASDAIKSIIGTALLLAYKGATN